MFIIYVNRDPRSVDVHLCECGCPQVQMLYLGSCGVWGTGQHENTPVV